MSDAEGISFSRRGSLGHVLLSRPEALNALTLPMIRAMHPQLDRWAADREVAAVVIEGAGGRAFCAGGDLRRLYDGGRASGDPLFAEFFGAEFRLNRRIFRYPKPYVAIIDGVTMGGGVGIAVHGSHRVAGERTLFAMPETGIGYFPDVGGSYFLPRCPGEIGMYLALTGARLKAADALYAGIATRYLPGNRGEALIEALAAIEPGAGAAAAVDAALAELAANPGPPPLAGHRALIDRCFAGESVEAILAALESATDPWAEKTARAIRQKSPTSLKVAYRQLRAGAKLDFEACMAMELRLALRFMEGHDFFEGVRAVVVDKDGTARWQPGDLGDVTETAVEGYFAPLGAGELTFN